MKTTFRLSLLATSLLLVSSPARAWDYDKVDFVDIDPLTVLTREWKGAKPAKARRVLFFNECYGYNHHGGRCYGEWTFKAAGEASGAWEIVKTADPTRFADANFLRDFDAIVFCNSTKLAEAQAPGMSKALMDYVRGGKGIALIHAGLDAFKDSDILLDFFGGYFRGHPWHADGTWRFKNEQPENPINASFRGEPTSFSRVDEIYQFPAFFNRETCNVLISMDLSDSVTKAAETWWENRFGPGATRHDHDYAVSWTREIGKGRIFYTSFGHDRCAFLDRSRLYHMFAGLQFVLGDLPVAKPAIRSDVAYQRLDWSNGPYFEQFTKRVKDMKGKDFDLVMFGDSITDGWVYSKDEQWTGGKEVWAQHFGHLRTSLLGISGDRTEHLLWRLTTGAQADGWTAKHIFVLVGINNALQVKEDGTKQDTPELCARGTKAVVDVLTAKHPEATIHLVGCLPTGSVKDSWVNECNRLVRPIADGRHVVYHDMGGLYRKPDGSLDRSLFRDGLHPNPAGYEKAAVEIERITGLKK